MALAGSAALGARWSHGGKHRCCGRGRWRGLHRRQNRRSRYDRLHLDTCGLRYLAQFLLLALALLLFAALELFLRAAERHLLRGLHVAEARLVVVRVRVGVFVILRDVLELFVAEFTVESFQDG